MATERANRLGPLLGFFVPVIFLARILLWPVLAGSALGGLLQLTGLSQCHLSPWKWGMAIPVLYYCWLLLTLSGYVVETTLLRSRLAKPRRMVIPASAKSLTAMPLFFTLYGRMHMLETLPGSGAFPIIPGLNWLWFRAYASSAHLGYLASIYGKIYDPDLTFIGDNVILGEASRIGAHAIVREPNGDVIFYSAPVKIGDNVTIGGRAQIDMGATIGEGSLIEKLSHVTSFTQVPPGEVWGGTPAVFRRKRDDSQVVVPDLPVAALTLSTSLDAVLPVVAEALNVPRDQIDANSGTTTCEFWDSVGKMAIAAALETHFGIAVEAEELFQLDSISDVVRAIERHGPVTKRV